jgi:hypothetical protein
MSDPALDAALAEAYATAPAGAVVLDTLEIWHPAFTSALRIVNDEVALQGRLEAGAPRQAGEIVTFLALAFKLRPPEITPDSVPVLEVEIDATDRMIVAEIDAAVATLDPVEVVWRRYLLEDAGTGPGYVVGGMVLISTSATPGRMVAQAGWPDLINEAFPRLDYTRETFPTLEYGA